MNTHPSYRNPPLGVLPDTRIVLYRFVKGLVIVAISALAIKVFLFDTVAIQTDQMLPMLRAGDRALVWRTPYAPLLKQLVKPGHGVPVVFRQPHTQSAYGCLRIAAQSGDTIAIAGGLVKVSGKGPWGHATLPIAEEELPADFSPRDNLAPLYLPRPGETLRLDSLGLREFFFYASLIAQENPAGAYTIKPTLFIDGRETPNVYIADFSLFRGSLDSIPPHLRYDWFFWDKLERYLRTLHPQNSVELVCALYQGPDRIFNYTLRTAVVFLLADNWSAGFDSRYKGPMLLSQCTGQVIAVLWSRSGATWRLRGDRLGKFVR